jgi:glycyl-tRNA synthetase beta chain
MKAYDFLLEVGTEEIPDWMIPGALEDLKRRFLAALGQQVEVRTDATPRRLILAARNVPERQPDSVEVITGPPVSAGEQAAAGFARKLGVEGSQLKPVPTPRGEYLTYTRRSKGRLIRDILSEALPDVILGVSWPKTMTWTGKSGPRFIRPIRWLIAIYGGRVVPFAIAGVKADRYTSGHRRLGQKRIRVEGLQSLCEELRKNFVLINASERRQRIELGIERLLKDGLRVRSNPALLETLVYMTEFPTPILGGFDPEFLSLPEEVLVTVMQHHQKYFSVEEATGKLAPHFIAVMNIDRDENGAVRHGHERVLRARFNDARFFWETDQKRKLAERLEDLKHVTFHARLGSYYDKTLRNVELVKKLGGDAFAVRAAELAKCDLTTELVKEFTELQGIVGGLYARAQGEPEEVALAIYDQYEALPRTRTGQILALADRLDTLQGFFGLGLIPSGSKDPFALRRAAQGIVRILVEGRHPYSLDELLAGSGPELRDFLLERVRYYFREVRGFRYDEINAVLAAGAGNLADAADRLDAISRVRSTANFEPLATSFKRIKNILLQAGAAGAAGAPDPGLLEAGPERELYEEFLRLRPAVERLKNERNYLEALQAIASLRPKVDLFFDKVLVMSPDEAIRRNRLAFLAELLREFSTIADFSEIVLSGE